METSLEYLNTIDWRFIWSIIRDIVLPHSGTLLLNTILFLFLGFIIALIYCIILYRKGILTRVPRYYNWAVKLYIPILFVGILYILGQWGFIRGVYKILDKERPAIVQGVYQGTMQQFFKNDLEKDKFIRLIQTFASETKSDSEVFLYGFEAQMAQYDTGSSFLNTTKNKLSKYLIENYGQDVYKAAIYGMLASAGKGHIDISEALPYEQYSAGMDFLLTVGHQDLEKIILEKLDIWCHHFLSTQYHGLIKSLLIFLILLMIVPLIEFFIYKKWFEPQFIRKRESLLDKDAIQSSKIRSVFKE
ncbi:hypothetical protein [Aquimarina addita]|uniref:hypothetical protein n=1 Tax=Aquimarina addita TaxID=870485 RepID=UPI0031E76C5D